MTEQEPKGRLVSEVLNKILPLIPESEKKLLDELQKFKLELHYKADEVQRGRECWIPFINILNFHMPDVPEIRDIVSGK